MSRHILFVAAVLLWASSRSDSQTVTASNGTIDSLLQGVSYRVNVDSNGVARIHPVLRNEAVTILKFQVSATPASELTVVLNLPGYCQDSIMLRRIPVSFSPTSGYIVETQGYFDPRAPLQVVMGAAGVLTIEVGVRLDTPIDLPVMGPYVAPFVATAYGSGGSSSSAEGLYSVTIEAEPTEVQPGPEVAITHALHQNHPNPFNPSTNITFWISPTSPEGPEGRGRADLGFVSLKIHDVLGREVATLVNETKGPGQYTVTWDAAGWPSGVYLYRLEVSSGRHRIYASTRKMACVR